MTLQRVVDLLEQGRAKGLHLGAQLEIRCHGRDPITIVVGDARQGVAMSADTLLPWFSCTKAVTAVAVAQLWERSRLGLDDPVADHLPEFGANGKAPVTIRHLLTHTGGFRTLSPPADAWRLEWDDLVARICASPVEDGWVIGERAGYSPITGFHILGEVVQRIDGRDFAAYVSEEILEPLDMGDSWMQLSEARYASYGRRMGVMYDTGPDRSIEPVRGMDSWRGFRRASPSGGGIGPMADLVKLYEMFLGRGEREGERVLEAVTVEAMSARHRAGRRDETFGHIIDWGLGLMINSWRYRSRPNSYGYGDHADARAFGHGGQQSSLAFADPQSGLAVALACNGRPGEVANHLRTQPVVTAIYEEMGLRA